MGENTFLGRVFTSATPVQNYSLGVPANGYYECGAFIDLVNPGAIYLRDPRTFGLVETVPVSVSGADVVAPDFVLPAGRALMGDRSEHRLAGTEERYSVLLSVVPNEWLPLAATFDSSSDGLSGPIDYRYEIGVFGGNPSNQQLWGTRLQPGTSSIEYNANGEASMTTLANGDYTWTIQIVDANENKALVTSSFSVASP